MKLSFSTLGCPEWSVQKVVETAARLGFNGVELRFIDGQSELYKLPAFTGSGLAETKKIFADHNIAVAIVDTDVHFHWPDAAKRQQNVEDGQRMAELASSLGAPGIRVFGDRIQPGQTREQTRKWVAEGMCALAGKVKPIGVWVETHGDFANSHDTREILRLANCEGVGTVWDPENCFAAYFEKPADGARALAPWIRHVHFKDIHKNERGEWKPALMGRGAFPKKDVLTALQQMNFGGFVSFEWEKKWEPEIPSADVAFPQFMEWMHANWKS